MRNKLRRTKDDEMKDKTGLERKASFDRSSVVISES